MNPITVHLIAAARPNFMKIAPLYHALAREAWCRPQIVHTGQHYDANMSDAFFRDLGLPAPHFHLEVGSGSHAEQTGGVMIAYEKVAMREKPDWIVVVGDVNSTAACAMVGTKLWIPVIHLEAGLRSGDRRMPEEINRLATDAICDVLWTPSPDADENLAREGVPPSRIDRVGNIMIDSFEMMRGAIEADGTRAAMGLEPGHYAVVTLHRPSNVDDPQVLHDIMGALAELSRELPLVFPVHPRTRGNLAKSGIAVPPGITLTKPLSYMDFLNLWKDAALVMTDSGGLQEETTALGIPCLTVRENTERPVTVDEGTNTLVGTDPQAILRAASEVLSAGGKAGRRPDLWDGQAAVRIVGELDGLV